MSFTSRNLQFRFATHFGRNTQEPIAKPITAPRGAVQLLERIILVRFSLGGNDRSRHSVRQLLTRKATIFGVIPGVSTNESATSTWRLVSSNFSACTTLDTSIAHGRFVSSISTTTRGGREEGEGKTSYLYRKSLTLTTYERKSKKKIRDSLESFELNWNKIFFFFFDKIMEQK